MQETKEQIYDRLIRPLMGQIIDICHQNKLPVVATFYLGGDLHCTTVLLDDDYDPSEVQIEAARAIYVVYGQLAPLTITTRDGDGKVTSIESVSG